MTQVLISFPAIKTIKPTRQVALGLQHRFDRCLQPGFSMLLICTYVRYRDGIGMYNNWFSKTKRFLCYSVSTKMPAAVCLEIRGAIAIHITVTWHMASILYEATSLQVWLTVLRHTPSQCNISPPNDQVTVVNVKLLPRTAQMEAKICTLCRTKIHRPEIFWVPNWKWCAVQLPS